MLKKIKKKIKKIYISAFNFFRSYLPHIVFLVFTFQLLSSLNTLPYFNIINRYYYYVFAILWVFSNFLFKKYITSRRILISGIFMFILAIPTSIIGMEFINDVLGFAAFILILTYLLREIIIKREYLRQT